MGARGCEAVVTELIQPFNHLILPVGTGTTMAGIANALHHLNKPTKVHGVVTLKDAEYLSARIRTLSAESINWQLHHGYHHGGFAKTSKALLQFIADKQTELQLPFEPVYSGKMVFAFWQMLTNRVFVPGEKVLLVHTGGVSV